MKENHPPKVRKIRRLSRFLCQELLYDFISGRLDSERAQAVKEYLYDDLDSQVDLESLDRALDYTAELSETTLSPELLHLFKEQKSFSARMFSALMWRNWPDMVRWSLEAVAISVVVAFVWISFPWMKIVGILPDSDNTELVRVDPPIIDKTEEAKLEKAATLHLEKKGIRAVEAGTIGVVSDKPEEQLSSKAANSKTKKRIAAAPVKIGKKAVVSEKSTKRSKKVIIAAKEVTGNDSTPAFKGILFRGFMKLENVRVVTPEVVNKIKALGGEKAGKVQLGWEKKNGNYFHFSLPESNYEVLLKDLRQYGPVRIYKDPHWRVMPEGKIRFILLIEGTDLINQQDQ